MTPDAFADAPKSVNVQPGKLTDALESLARQCDVDVIYPSSQFKGLTTEGVSGVLETQAAFRKLIAGTSLILKQDGKSVLIMLPTKADTAAAQVQGAAVTVRLALNSSAIQNTENQTPSNAQSSSFEPAAGVPGNRLEEVVVTAQKRTENLQNVPVSVQVISGQSLAEQNINTLSELTATVPGVHIAAGQQSNQLFIRGIGSGDNAFFEQAVATFVDDIYHGRSRMSGATFLDLERIEVLKGPQTTFFGNNATAGALNIVSRKPGDHVEGWARALYGDFGQYALEGAIGGPITDTFGARLAVTRSGIDDGWIHNVNLDRDGPRVNNRAGRLTLAFTPTEQLDVTFKIDAGERAVSGSSRDQPFQWTYCPPPAPFVPGDDFDNFGACAEALALGPEVVPIGLDNDRNTGIAGLGNWLSTFEDVLTINYRHWDHTFTSVSGYYDYDFNAHVDPINLPQWVNTLSLPEKYRQLSQEFRVASPTGQTIEYLAGAYIQTGRLTSDNLVGAPVVDFFGPILGIPPEYLPIAALTHSKQRENVKSLFGSLTWNATDQLRLNAAIRGSWVHKSLVGTSRYGRASQPFDGFVEIPPEIEAIWGEAFGAPGTGEELSRSDQDWMPSAGIQYFMAPETMVYFSYNRGFKAGGINGDSPLSSPEVIKFGPEHVNSYELGLKSKFFEDTVLMNLSVFRSDYEGLQVNAYVFDPLSGGFNSEVRNAASSRSQGVELEGQWAVGSGLRVAANVTYLDSYYVNYSNAPPSGLSIYCANSYVPLYCSGFPNPVPAFRDLSGERTPYSPRWSGSVRASYDLVLSSGYRLTTELNPYAQSSYNPDPDGLYPALAGYVRLDAVLTLANPDDRWALSLIARNVTDRIIPVGQVGGGGQVPESKEQPRNFAVQLRYQF